MDEHNAAIKKVIDTAPEIPYARDYARGYIPKELKPMVGPLTRDAILAARDIETEEVAVPQWGGTVMVRGMTGTERDAFEAGLIVETKGRRKRGGDPEVNLKNARAKLCVCCIVDENGSRVFRMEDAKALGQKSGAAIDLIYDVAMRLSGISEDDVQDLAEEMVEDPFEGSPSASPASCT